MKFKSTKSPYVCEQNDKLMIIRQQKKPGQMPGLLYLEYN